MQDFTSKKLAQPQEADRRRIGKVVHDDRGNAYVTWHEAPPDHKREVLEIVGHSAPKVRADHGFDPYARLEPRAPAKPGKPKDLRALGQWIKMMRELEARQRATVDEE